MLFGEDGHYYVFPHIVFNVDINLNRKVRFMLDTGAFITVLTPETAKFVKHENWKMISDSYTLTGFAGSGKAMLKQIPKLVIGDRSLTDVKVAIPYKKIKYNILGMNVLEHFKFLVDTENELIYFDDNPNYKLSELVKSNMVLSVDD